MSKLIEQSNSLYIGPTTQFSQRLICTRRRHYFLY